MRTLLLSDLHLGSLSGADLLRRAELREPLLEAAAGADRVVLLGDLLELRHGPLHEAMASARPFFEELGQALAGRELVLVAGNHDHALIEPWLARRGALDAPPELGLEQILEPAETSTAYATLAEWAGPALTQVAYPGLWVREDVYAMHGHFLDCHLTLPTLERLSVGAMGRLLRRPPHTLETVADYEAMGAPMFAWRDAVARDAHTGAALNGMATVRAWRALGGSSEEAEEAGRDGAGELAEMARLAALRRRAKSLRRTLRRRAFAAGFPLAVGALNRAGLGPLSADISPQALRLAGLEAMGEVAARLGLGDAHVIFGHTHRPGPLPRDAPAEWLGRGGARLHNTGSWTYAAIFLRRTAQESPYWPGACVLVEQEGAPRVVQLLHDRPLAQLRPSQRVG
jgi:UDP-2,3-diacylglucosamine pyrophosphatase LpxH